MLSLAVRNTKKLIREMSKSDNVRLGRFFTKPETARQMAGAFTFVSRYSVRVLDAGAGTGILSAALIEALAQSGGVTEVYLTCYENNPLYLPRLTDNLERIRKKARHDFHVKVRITILEEDFLSANHPEDERYDYIITNPPQELTDREDLKALFPQIFTTPTFPLACLFSLTAAGLLAEDGQLVTVLPLSTASAVSQTALRKKLFSLATPERIFLYSREKQTSPLRPVLCLKLREGNLPPRDIEMAVSSDDGTPEHTTVLPPLPYDAVVREKDASLLLIHDKDELSDLLLMQNLPCTFSTFGLRVHTGRTLESRYPALLRDKPEPGTIPLLHPKCLKDGVVQFPLPGVPKQYLIPSVKSLAQPAKNILLLKRVPAKSDKRRITCAACLKNSVPAYFSTSNKLNYIDVDGDEQMDPGFLFGLIGFLSSAPVDIYLKMVSKSGQLNAKELSSLPLPTAEQLRMIGGRLMAVRSYKADYCDKVVRSVLNIL